MPTTTETYRLFFALWPETELLSRIQPVADHALKDCPGRRIPSQNWHITLAFIGSVNADSLHCMQQVASQLSEQAFVLRLDKLGYWPKPKIIYLAPTNIPEPLIRLQASLSRSLAIHCGYQPETRAYRPHFSLMRKAPSGPDEVDIPPIDWQVKTLSLVRSHTRPQGVEYEVLNYWPLRD